MDNKAQGTLKLRMPFMIDDKEITEISYNFENLPSTAIRDVVTELGKSNYVVVLPSSDQMYNLLMFGLAADIHYHDIQRLHPYDQNRAASKSMSFFNNGLEE